MITLQKISPTDIDAFIALEQAVSADGVYRGATTREIAERELNNDIIYFITQGDEAIGSVQFQEKGNDVAYISGLSVIPEYRNKGVGKEAIRQLLELLKDMRRIELVVYPDNHAALSIYKSLGFTIESLQEDYFGDGDTQQRLLLAINR